MKAANLPLPYYGVSSEGFLVDQTSNCFKNTLKKQQTSWITWDLHFFSAVEKDCSLELLKRFGLVL